MISYLKPKKHGKSEQMQKNILAGIFSTIAVVVALSFVSASAQTTDTENTSSSTPPVSSITFPIPELGGCTSKENCRQYCEQTANMAACIDFAKKHKLMTTDEADRAGKFAKQISQKNGPGGCTSPQSCKEYCSDVTHLDECMSFAQKNGLKGEEFKRGEKIQSFLKTGGTMPGGCTSQETCQQYCQNFDHAKECMDFAKKAGLAELNKRNGTEGPNASSTEDRMLKLATFAANGETPGGCKSKEECEKYCQDKAHMQECVEFAKKMGFAPRAGEMLKNASSTAGNPERNMIRPMMQKPGEGNDENHGTSSPRRPGDVMPSTQNMPPEIAQCVKEALGNTSDGKASTTEMTSEISMKIRACIEKMQQVKRVEMQTGQTGENKDGFRMMPPLPAGAPRPPREMEKRGSDSASSSGPLGLLGHAGDNLAAALMTPIHWFVRW